MAKKQLPRPAEIVKKQLNSELKRRIANGGIVTATVMVSPRIVEKWLARGATNNRPVRKRKVAEYAAAMKDGAWVPSSQGISFSSSGILLDGQHRLHAVQDCGKTIKMRVTFNEPKNHQKTFDQNLMRQSQDILRMSGMDWIKSVHAAVIGVLYHGPGARHAKRMDIYEKIARDLSDGLRFVYNKKRIYNPGIRNSHTLAACVRAYYDRKISRQRLDEFITVLGTGTRKDNTLKPEDHAAVLLRNLLQSNKGVRGYAFQKEVYHKTERALLAFARGDDMKQLRAYYVESFPFTKGMAAKFCWDGPKKE